MTDKKWWKEGVAYQIYPASFKDENGDGLGDIPGIISKVDYLKDLGVDIVWVSPMFESPQIDMGYDISNYEAVHAPYGTVEDMELLISECHKRGMRLILDLVINHTSDQHAWFKESRSSRDNPKRDWYIWRPLRHDEAGNHIAPTNWRSYFGGPAWEFDEATGEYYLHLFAREQPDLNWESEACRQAIYDSAMRFWLDKGVDGFRVDTVNMYSKGPVAELRDAPIVVRDMYEQPAWDLYANGPRMHEFLREMNEEVLGRYDTMTVGELPHTPEPASVLSYVGAAQRQLSMVFQFDLVDLGQGTSNRYIRREWKLPQLKGAVAKWQQFIDGTDGWTTAFCENHDQGRSISRFASDAPEYRVASAKMLALFMCSLTGTLFIYQGQEIGMVNVPQDWPIDEYKDIEGLRHYRQVAKATDNNPEALAEVLKNLSILGRDNARTPMQWDGTAHAGFTSAGAVPWMRVNDSYTEINVAKQLEEPDSVLKFWRAMIKFRKAHADLLTYGTFDLLDMENEQTFAFVKNHGGEKSLVALNFSDKDQQVDVPRGGEYVLQVSSYAGDDQKTGVTVSGGSRVTLRPWEGHLYIHQ
ncbi:family 13 glycoside hydrolase [Cryphonectria parasitica EP155]|uniref:Family 13 glycoside hydrolase n=1 Tax=Cryphonectria parasitica (strain ATCC 38755 / EP155) TaxID=660469 RepID=A0A9P5CUH3_CRYP1|nr:family 13 glycoside hydrolase [Cryphonectria parasitica EP155]KAF3770406.1 family 13 glycoside hydrolase [Cryphonectria parasitica EP155]